MATWAKPVDVTGPWIGDDVPGDDTKLQLWIEKAEREIRRKVPGIQVRIDAEAAETPARDDLLNDAIDVTVAMVSRVFRNPMGARTVADSLGTGPMAESRSVTLGGETPGALALTSDELEKLQGVAPQGAFTVSMIPASSPFYRG